MEIVRAAARATRQAPGKNFTGTVLQDEVAVGAAPSRLRATVVSFTPGARTNWHSHAVHQVLWCLSGAGRIQKRGEPVQILRPGDAVLVRAGEIHWHGAAPDRLFAHLSMVEAPDAGEATTWLEPVSDADYTAAPPAAG
jgi:quercetin dioxygenase-like cupin family protein